jgi:sigma-54 dependent transcriptional regulator, acetoin dehydrogenase operon transcriptional activator AcoR
MKSRRILLVAAPTPEAAMPVERYLAPFVGGHAQIGFLSDRANELPSRADLIFVTDARRTESIASLAGEIRSVPVLWTFARDSLRRLAELPNGSRALVACAQHDEPREVVRLLHELTMQRLDLGAYPDETVEPCDAVIAVEDAPRLPEGIGRIVRIGSRVPAPCTVMEALLTLGLYDERRHRQLNRYARRVAPLNCDMQFVLEQFYCVQQCLKHAQLATEDGAVHFDHQRRIFLASGRADRLLDRPVNRLVGQRVDPLLRELGVHAERRDEQLTVRKERALKVRLHTVPIDAERAGGVLTVHDTAPAAGKARRRVPEGETRFTARDIVGTSEAARLMREIPQRIAGSSSPVLIVGESGTGKEVLAQAIHDASTRLGKPFVSVNCGAIPASLIESELFGYESGAFTGARRAGKPGLFECAHTGTIFLDEIGDMPLEEQARLLRVLEEGELRRLGGERVRYVDVRVIAATNRDLAEMMAAKRFRADLYYRLNVVPVRVAPLRERKEDIPLLVQCFLEVLGCRQSPSTALLERLQAYDWPGNIRELRNCIEYLLTVGGGNWSTLQLPPHIEAALGTVRPGTAACPRGLDVAGGAAATDAHGLDVEQRYLLRVVARANSAGRGIGRRAIARQARAEGVPLTEGEIRHRMQDLARLGFLQVARGRGGTKLTAAGRAVLAGLLTEPLREASNA